MQHNASKMAAKFKVGDLVWAKLKGFSAWPGKIIEPLPDVKRPSKKTPHHFVLFGGAENYAWVPEEGITPYVKMREKYLRNPRLSKGFREAVDSIESFWQALPASVKDMELLSLEEESADNEVSKDVDVKSNGSAVKRKATTPQAKNKGKKSTGSASSRKGIPVKRAAHTVTSGGDHSLSKFPKTSAELGLSSKSNSVSCDGYVPKFEDDVLEARPSVDDSRIPTEEEEAYALADREKANTEMYGSLKSRAVIPTPLRIGFLGLGIMGQGMVMNLLRSGHEVTVWNRTGSKTTEFSKAGAFRGKSPADVVRSCDIIFTCVSDSVAVRDVVFGIEGVMQAITKGKCYVEMSTVDEETVQDVADAVMSKGGTFLEAPVCGSRVPALEGQLVILTSGDRKLHEDCYSCFEAMGKKAIYLGNEVGTATRMKLIHNMMLGNVMASLAEAMALAEKVGLDQEDLHEVLTLGGLNSPIMNLKGQAILNQRFDPHFPLQHQQKDLRLVLSMGDSVEQPLFLAAAANEMYKKARRQGAAEEDTCAVYKAASS